MGICGLCGLLTLTNCRLSVTNELLTVLALYARKYLCTAAIKLFFVALCSRAHIDVESAADTVSALENAREDLLGVRILNEIYAIRAEGYADADSLAVIGEGRLAEEAVCDGATKRCLVYYLVESLCGILQGRKMRKDTERLCLIESATLILYLVKKLCFLV